MSSAESEQVQPQGKPQSPDRTWLETLGDAAAYVGGGIATTANALWHVMTHTPIPSELQHLITEEEMTLVSREFYGDLQKDYHTPTTIGTTETMEEVVNPDGSRTIGKRTTIIGSSVNPTVNTMAHMPARLRMLHGILFAHNILDVDALDARTVSQLNMYLMEKFGMLPYLA